MGQVLSLPFRLLKHTSTYYGGFFHFLCGKGRHEPYEIDLNKSIYAPLRPSASDGSNERRIKQHTRIHLFNLAANFYLYNKPHYRKGSYRDDLVDNLRNVAVPGTGIPLSLFAWSRFTSLGFLLTLNPAICMVASFHQWIRTRGKSSISQEFERRLLTPDDWFSYWRLNCTIVGLHALLNDMPKDYEMENKWTFLEEGMKRGVPVSPFLKTPAIVVKHRNEEGGLGIFFYKNALHGGDWIIQERIENSAWVNSFLPENAPLSTFRVITCSKASISMNRSPDSSDIRALSCVFRAGRQGAATDHDSILFDIDVTTGLIRGGTTNAHWYKLGLYSLFTCPWRSEHGYEKHPDGDIPVKGGIVPHIGDVLKLVENSHLSMCPRVPFAGWDVVFSSDPALPVCLLEVNLSCNFFRGSFDQQTYLDFLDDSLNELQSIRIKREDE